MYQSDTSPTSVLSGIFSLFYSVIDIHCHIIVYSGIAFSGNSALEPSVLPLMCVHRSPLFFEGMIKGLAVESYKLMLNKDKIKRSAVNKLNEILSLRPFSS